MLFKKKTLKDINNRWKKEFPLLKRQEEIRRAKEKLYAGKVKTSMTKKLMLFIVVNCTLIELFTGYLMYRQLELSVITGLSIDMGPQVTLISAVVTESIAFCVYCYKSMKENIKSGIVYETTMFDKEIEKLKLENNFTEAKG